MRSTQEEIAESMRSVRLFETISPPNGERVKIVWFVNALLELYAKSSGREFERCIEAFNAAPRFPIVSLSLMGLSIDVGLQQLALAVGNTLSYGWNIHPGDTDCFYWLNASPD